MSSMCPDPAAVARHFDSAAAKAHWLSEWERLNAHAVDGTFRVVAVQFAEPVEA